MENKFQIICETNSNEKEPSISITVVGELNGSTAHTFEKEVKEIFLKQPQNLNLNLEGVTVFVSAAIGSLLLLQDFVNQKGFKIKIVALNDKIKEIIKITGLDKVLAL